MEINVTKLKNSLYELKSSLKVEDKYLNEFLRLNKFSENDVERVINYLGDKLIDLNYTELIGRCFPDIIMLIVTTSIRSDDDPSESLELYQIKCIALSKLITLSPDVLSYSTKYFRNRLAPFDKKNHNETPPKKVKKSESPIKDLLIVKCCYNLISSAPSFFKDLWDWSEFINNYLHKGSSMQKLYCNHVIAILSNMSQSQLNKLNDNIPDDTLLIFSAENRIITNIAADNIVDENDVVKYSFTSNVITNIEGVLLPIFNYNNSRFYEHTDGNYDKIVKVDSTKVNLRSIALGISSSKAICLSGPVGCGKTTLVEYLARKTGRITPKKLEIESFENSKEDKLTEQNKRKSIKQKNKKRRDELISTEDDTFLCNDSEIMDATNGFLRIHLGDQTDSKMLLGQYRCTDVPGEFIWLPGVLTQAVMNGYWLLLEDLDCATQDTYTILSNLLENNFLSVPGFRDCVKIEPGFQLFVTVRTNQSTNSAQKTLYSLIEKYLYTINILPLSRNELCKVVSTNFPKLKTIANRVVDVFLTFSSGNHTSADYLRNQEKGDKADKTERYISLPFGKISLSNITNSGRLVSTRDLIKLCQRSNPMFSVTSAECAYFVFQNAVDVFCSYLPYSIERIKLIASIGAKLGIIQSRCEFFAKEYKPDVVVDIERIKVGRAELYSKYGFDENISTKEKNSDQPVKRLKISKTEEKLILSQKNDTSVTFSFTRVSSCLLERIAVCVSQSEPILLVGETGVGKTSSVQYLAEKTHHKLVVVNMNNQSDVSDLVGGFKPVDLNYVMAPIRSEFENLFRKTFNQNKNEAFLNKFSICYNQGNFNVLIKLMIKVSDSIFERAKNGTLKQKDDLVKWHPLHVKLLKLNSQLSQSINISFAFIPGSLVNCIKNGEWVLLDEINLASAETLECLSTILEPDGSVVLLEKGDFMPVKRHPEFRIFACMNPNTDIGKKDLPVGIRNRFTEFFVDDLTLESDLILLVSDYLSNTGIEKRKVSYIVKLYKKLKSLSQLELNDGLGNRPVFSLRTLCRALRICAKNLCGSIERNLYESLCLSFLTQLDPVSHALVLDLIKSSMLTNAKAILSQGIPKPGDDFLNFEGYWIEKGPKEILECENYILTNSVKDNLKDLSRIISIGKLPILLQGPTSAGKTSLIEYVAKRSGNHCLRINNHEHTDLQEYIGTYTSDVSGKLSFKEGVLVQAMRNGYWIILDELNLASTDILEALNRVLDDNRELFIPETQTVVKAHPNFMLFATQNPPGLYGGRKTLSRAFKNRFIELHFSEIPRNELEIILEKRCLIPESYAKKMVKCMWDLQKNRKTTTKNVFTLRDLFRWGNRYTFADKKLLDNNLYDWNQHLIEEGFLVLSAKVRTDIEIEIIEETMYHNFRKRINLDYILNLNEKTSPVVKDILESIKNHCDRSDIVWTRNMTRMAVLTAKALQFNEPVLLVGPTGCGKTTVCQILANVRKTNLRILNCHMHTEGADFLGGLRPCRQTEENLNDSKHGRRLFEWADGPLVLSMQDGSYFMADEISLAEDSVLERLNCILEPDRTVLLAEKGGVSSSNDSEYLSNMSKEFVVQAKNGFQFLATMNPGGDFGKKELSPALRNRFTEIWCKPSDTKEDLVEIASNCISAFWKQKTIDEIRNIATYLVDVVFYVQNSVDKFKFSIRDILAWANYLIQNSEMEFSAASIFGLETLFLDSLEMLPHESAHQIENIRENIINFSIKQAKTIMNLDFTLDYLNSQRGDVIETLETRFGIKPFYIETNFNNNSISHSKNQNFLFDAPTTKQNLFRLLSALSLNKAVLLEGPPGVGKTSIVENLAKAIGYKIVRINLCEHTDLADLFGTDLPAEEKSFEDNSDGNKTIGSFVWRDGPLLAALKSQNTWILLDELNLAPQSVLEGLNAILDHRGEVFIPELNKTFVLGKQTRIFACQNPLRQGGGRKGLPQSFLNRFTKVYLKKLSTEDLLFVVNGKYFEFFNKIEHYFSNYLLKSVQTQLSEINLFSINDKRKFLNFSIDETNRNNIIFDLPQRMVNFSQLLDQGISDLDFGYRGGPFEVNLRDILRWCDLLNNDKTGFIFETNPEPPTPIQSFKDFELKFNNFMLILFERMKLVYYQRMRCKQDKEYILNAFRKVFACDAEYINNVSEDVGFYWTEKNIYLNDIVLERDSESALRPIKNKNSSPFILSSQLETIKNLVECVHMEKPVLLCGPTDSGKTKIIDILCTVSNEICNLDTIDDSVTGSFQQIDLNRHLEEISQNVECIFIKQIQNIILKTKDSNDIKEIQLSSDLIRFWSEYSHLTNIRKDQNVTVMSDELILFQNRIQYLNNIIDKLLKIEENYGKILQLKEYQNILESLKYKVKYSESLNTGGKFEWVDSKIVKSLKVGQYISLEHVNLCSSAVLDRLNPVFEPNGNLLISEKGVSANDEAEIVEKHKNFRAFLTIDPKNGELSRAMRNRCVEISLLKDNYTLDDLRVIIYQNGIDNIDLINIILKIHDRIKTVTNVNNFNVSHLIQFAFLVNSYKKIGYPNEKAIYVSGMEVYVYSSNTDLMGYGLEFYQNKLRQIVVEESENIIDLQMSPDCALENIILTCNNLDMLSMVRLQCEPLKILLTNYKNPTECKKLLSNLFTSFEDTQFDCNLNLIKFYTYMLYESCSYADLSIRHSYLSQMLSNCTKMEENELVQIVKLSQSLHENIKNSFENYAITLKYLPRNRKLMPRIRDYSIKSNPNDNQELRLSAVLLCDLLINEVENQKVTKLTEISALAYSQAISSKTISDSLNNDFLKHLYIFLSNIKEILCKSLETVEFKDLTNYCSIIHSYLWANRITKISLSKLFHEKLLNYDLIDKLILHFKWMNKNLFKTMEKLSPNFQKLNSNFNESYNKLINYIQSAGHPLNLQRKIYHKHMTEFDPLYSLNQIKLYELKKSFSELTNIIPAYGSYSYDTLIRKIIALMSDNSKKFKAMVSINKPEIFMYIERPTNLGCEANIPKKIIDSMHEFIKLVSMPEEHVQLNFDEIENSLEPLANLLNSEKEIKIMPSIVEIEMLPLKEFFVLKMISASSQQNYNEMFFDNMALNGSTFELVKILTNKEYKNFEKLWDIILQHIETIESVDEFTELFNYLSAYYRNFSTFYRLIQNAQYKYQLENLSTRNDACLNLNGKEFEIYSDSDNTNGPPLTMTVFKLLFQSDGNLRPISLENLNVWKSSLNNIRQIVWNNSTLMTTTMSSANLNSVLVESKKLLLEIEYVQNLCKPMKKDVFKEYNEQFQQLVNKLKIQRDSVLNEYPQNMHASIKKQHVMYRTSMLKSIIGSIELCLLSFTPLIDPVEKNRLKHEYINEDVECLLTLFNSYDIMKIVMKYKNFGTQICNELLQKITDLVEKKNKFVDEVALRPETCLYGALVQDITHFLKTNCEPQTMLDILACVEDAWNDSINFKPTIVDTKLIKLAETSKRLELWISNSQRFLHHTMKKYQFYYKDFVMPIECSIGSVKFGFNSLKKVLDEIRYSIVLNSSNIYVNINENGKLAEKLVNIINYPNFNELNLFDKFSTNEIKNNRSSIFTILDKVDGSEKLYFTLLKAKVLEIRNQMSIASEISEKTFREFDFALNICNKIWQEEEERRRKQIADEESLYVNKTRCATEDEEIIEMREVHENFPNYAEEDFGEFVAEDSLEKVIKISNDNKTKKTHVIIRDEDFKFLAEHFVAVMKNYSKLYYYTPELKPKESHVDFISPFQEKVKVFVKVFNELKPSLNEWIDESIYNSFSFAVGLQQEMLKEINISGSPSRPYNFYKDSNIPEIISCTEVLEKIEERVNVQLDLYPDHASLVDILKVIKRIRSLSSTSSVVRFNTGFQILRQKIAQWNEVAHKNNNLKDLEAEVAEYVQRWTKLELQFWRNCLSQTYDKVQSNAYKYWFFIYNLFNEYLQENQIDATYTDIRETEKRFVEGETVDPNAKSTTIDSKDIIKILRQFVEASTYGDFQIRMDLLKSFEFYLHNINTTDESKKLTLISSLHNLQIYFDQFAPEIEETKKSMRTPIEKKLKEFVKIESYNKDLSYFSMKNNVARVHRNLNKFLKEYEHQLKTKISAVFQPKDATVQDYNLEKDKGKNLRHEPKIKYYMIDVKNFIASPKLKEKFLSEQNSDELILLNKTQKLFMTSRNVVKETIANTNFPTLIYSLDLLFCDQIEACDYLRKLEVDRSLERPKQKLHAKQILQQKRKALSDLFKTLSNLGISFKTGIMELAMLTDFEDYSVMPFCVKNMLSSVKDKKIDQNILFLSENLDKYYAKCVFKLKLLQNIMLTPLSELGPPNIERIKGFAIDMFLLVQKQRILLSHSIRNLFDLRMTILKINSLATIVKDNNMETEKLNFLKLRERFTDLKAYFCKVCFVFEQFVLFLQCIPEQESAENSILAESSVTSSIVKDSEKFEEIFKKSNSILDLTKVTLTKMAKNEGEFLNYEKICEFEKALVSSVNDIEAIRNCFAINNGFLSASQPLIQLLEYAKKTISNDYNYENEEQLPFDNIDVELENIIHSILLSKQKLFKKYQKAESVDSRKGSPNKVLSDKNEDDIHTIQENHLKGKLFNELNEDWESLNIQIVLDKITNILLALKYSQNIQNKSSYIRRIVSILPILEQFNLLGDYYLFQQLGSHKVSVKMLSVMLTVFVELGTKGFCVPQDLMKDEEGEAKKNDDQKEGEGFGLEDGTGEKDASDKLESEDQLDDAKRPEDRKDEEKKDEDCKEEKGIEMSDDFEGKMQDIDKPEDDDSGESEDDEDMNKEMGETEDGADKLDDQIWGSDEENEQEEDEEDDLDEEDNGKGTKDEDDNHNNLDSKNETQKGQDDDEQNDGLDATDNQSQDNEKKKQEKDIDNMKDPEIDEDHVNPYHNELEEPPEAEDMDLGEMQIDEDKDGEDPQQDENPFDIDKMKENMPPENEENDDGEKEDGDGNENKDNQSGNDSDSDEEPEAGTLEKNDEVEKDDKNKEEDMEKSNEEDAETQTRGDIEEEKLEENESDEQNKANEEKPETFEESKDKASKEENIQSVPETDNKGSNDEVQNTENEKVIEQEQEMDAQDTGEEKEGVGQAENETSERGHEGVADTKETKSNEDRKNEKQTQEKRKQGQTDEQRSLGEADKNKLKQLKTIDKLKNDKPNENDKDMDDDEEIEADEYQHIKDPKSSDKITLDNATEEQSKKVQNLEDKEQTDDEDLENNDELMEVDEENLNDEDLQEYPDLKSEKVEQKSNKPSKSEKSKENTESEEKVEVEGEIVKTINVPRSSETTAHSIKEILMDTSTPRELSAAETLELRQLYQNQLTSVKATIPEHDDYESWQIVSNKMLPNARELCEQLRLILEPTKCTRLKGDYRTGRRINMKKIIPYIASQFRKDKIWLRRTKPAQRDYKITIAIDDSKSMHHNNSKLLTLQAISLVSQALTLLESGKLSIMSFGESPKIVLNHTEQFDGPKLVKSLEFSQDKTNIAELLDFVRTVNTEEGSMGSDNGLFENLLLVLSDGRNIFSEGKVKVKNAIKLARLQRIFLVYIIIDNPENKNSILDVQTMEILPDKKLTIKPYLDEFPFPYYVIVRDLGQLPIVLSEAMRQWFELVNSEQ